MQECQTCGFVNPSDSNFCGQCGARLLPPSSDTTHIMPVVEYETAAFDDTDAASSLAPGTALLIATRGLDSGTRYLLDKPRTTVGRAADNGILLHDITVSRHHAAFDLTDGVVVVSDLNSLNGTYVNRELINGPTTLKRGDEVQIGKFRMVLLVNDHGTL